MHVINRAWQLSGSSSDRDVAGHAIGVCKHQRAKGATHRRGHNNDSLDPEGVDQHRQERFAIDRRRRRLSEAGKVVYDGERARSA